MTGGDVSLNGVEYGGLCDENKNYDISKHSSTDFNEHSLMVVSCISKLCDFELTPFLIVTLVHLSSFLV